MKNKIGRCLAVVIAVLLSCSVVVQAESTPLIVEKYTTRDGIVMYVKGLDSVANAATYQVGTQSCSVDSVTSLKDCGEQIRTLILWDNSLSAMDQFGESVKDILTDVVANRISGEEFAIATLGEEITYLVDYTNDYASLKQIIGNVEAEDKSVNIVEDLYEAVESFNLMEDSSYKRIIVISDGVDASKVGYSKEELEDLLSKTSYPIYTLGIAAEDKYEDLQNLFSLARTTGGECIYLDRLEENFDAVEILSEDYGMTQVKITVPEEMRDGSTLNSKLSIEAGSQTYTLQSKVTLPFLEPSEEEENAVAATESAETAETEKSEEAAEVNISLFGKEVPRYLLFIIGGILIFIIVCVVAIVALKRSHKRKSTLKQKEIDARRQLEDQLKNPFSEIGRESARGAKESKEDKDIAREDLRVDRREYVQDNKTFFLGASQDEEDESTEFPDDVNYLGREMQYQVILINREFPDKRYQCALKGQIVIGRRAEYSNIVLEGDTTVSKAHCRIYSRNGKCYIEDVGSVNGTYVNKFQISSPVEVDTGCIIRIGKCEYMLEIRQQAYEQSRYVR